MASAGTFQAAIEMNCPAVLLTLSCTVRGLFFFLLLMLQGYFSDESVR